ncbi:hypothetical protein GQ55_4G012800 [Panicum hallii var. hallii]|uniref:Uncharacterized protein n=1 Tax=Panicum hallii var. hallii TaxID=1504633 RepID=A0A2T7DU33_9POAL|nr:hypothetical protein GQ55_4G012800 [Panicum hallii var. hallii]
MANKNATSPAHPAVPCTTQKPAGHPQHATRLGATFSQENNKLSEGTSTTTMRTRTDHIESLRRRVILAESEVAEEKENVRRGLEAIRWKDAQLKELRKRYSAMDKDIRRKDAHLKVARKRVKTKERLLQIMYSIWMDKAETDAEMKAQKEVEMQELKVQKEAQVQKVMKENVRLLRIVDKEAAQLQAMSEQCKLLAQQIP